MGDGPEGLRTLVELAAAASGTNASRQLPPAAVLNYRTSQIDGQRKRHPLEHRHSPWSDMLPLMSGGYTRGEEQACTLQWQREGQAG